MLEIRQLKKSYKINDSRSVSILNNINIKFPDKGLYFILGKSGCGKSTLLNIMSGLLEADSGEIIYSNKNILKLNKKEKNNFIRNEIGILFQSYNLINDMTVSENLDVAKSVKNSNNDDAINALLTSYGLEDKKNQKIFYLSGGEKQRVSLVRSLVNKPSILFCDEPTGALDENNSIKMMNLIKDVSKDTLVLVVTHNMELCKTYCDGYIYLENGTIKEQVGNFDIFGKKENKVDKKKKSRKFISKIASKNIKTNCGRNLLNAFSSFFSIAVLLITLMVKTGILESENKLLSTYGDQNTFSVSLIKSENINDSPIHLERYERPSFNQINTLIGGRDYIIDYSYDYVFSNKVEIVHGISYEKKFDKFDIKPVYIPSLPDHVCIMNKALRDQLTIDKYLNEIMVKSEFSYSYYNETTMQTINENFVLDVYFTANKVVDEFGYMNTPTLYYQTTYLEEHLKKLPAKKTIAETDEDISFYDLLVNAKNDSEVSSYKMNIFCLSDENRSLLYKLVDSKNENKIFKLENDGYTLVTSFIKISKSVFLGMNIFIGLVIITTLFICGFLSYSSALFNRKESAILSSLGATNDEIVSIYMVEQLSYSVMGALLGVLVTFISYSFLNNQFANFFKIGSLLSIDYIGIISIFIIFVVVSIMSCFVPLKLMKMRNVSEELREE